MATQTLKAYLDSLTEDTTPDAAADFVITKDTSASLLKKVKLNKIGGSAFGTVAVSGQSDVVADQINDTLTLVAGANITITTTPVSDAITIAASGGGGGSFPANVYAAIVTQTGTANPTATVLQNDLGGTVVWARSGVGVYSGTLTAAFPAGKVIVTLAHDYNGAFQYFCSRADNNSIELLSTDFDTTPLDINGGTVTLYILVYP